MSIIDADSPIIDNQIDFKIDNQVERTYLYVVSSSDNPNFSIGLKFSKYNQKFNGLDIFISENDDYYIWGNLTTITGGSWVITKKIGTIIPGDPTTTYNVNFKSNPGTIENKTFNASGGSRLVITKITTRVILQ